MKTKTVHLLVWLVGTLVCIGNSAANDDIRTLDELKPAWNKLIPVTQRFVDALGGNAVLDKETGLVWAKSPNKKMQLNWQQAMDVSTVQRLGGCGGWRLPTIEELASIVVSLPSSHPFTNVDDNDCYWSSSSDSADPSQAWFVRMGTQELLKRAKVTTTNGCYAWPVRGGK